MKRAGTLRQILMFEVPLVEIDSDGAQIESWMPAFEVSSQMPAEVVALSGRELIAAQAVQSKVSTRIRVMYRPGFAARMRARLGSTIYDIQAVIPDPDSRIRWVTLLCSDGVNQG